MRITGVSTIQGLVGQPPSAILVPYEIMRTTEMLKQAWNALHMAMIPYCFSCKVPLDWIAEEPDNEIGFVCPKCNREWLRAKPEEHKGIVESQPKPKCESCD